DRPPANWRCLPAPRQGGNMLSRRSSAFAVMVLALSACSQDSAPPPAATSTATPATAAPTRAANVTAERLANADAEPGQWLSHGRTWSEQRFSPLDQINTSNVSQLGLAFYVDLDTRRGQEATPLMIDDTLYIATAWS